MKKLSIITIIAIVMVILIINTSMINTLPMPLPKVSQAIPDPTRFDIVLVVTGQSNAVGINNILNLKTAEDVQLDNVYMYQPTAGKWVRATPSNEPFNGDYMDYAYFAGKYIHETTGLTVGYIKHAVSGQEISKWDQQIDGSIYDDLTTYTKSALSLIDNEYIDAVLWHQGESDSRSWLIDDYQESLNNVIGQFKKECFWNSSKGMFIAGEIIEGSNDLKDDINVILNTLNTDGDPKTGTVDVMGWYVESLHNVKNASDEWDQTHFNRTALKILAEKYSQKLIAMRSNVWLSNLEAQVVENVKEYTLIN